MIPLSKKSLPALSMLTLATLAGAQDPGEPRAFYRVEAIVFTHASGASDEWPTETLSDHGAAVDPAWRAFGEAQQAERAMRETGRDDLESALDIVDALASLESGERSLAEALLYPEPWLAQTALSKPMSEAFERLTRDGSYQVQDVLAWYQPLEDASDSRRVRLHDDRVLRVDWIQINPAGRLLKNGQAVSLATQLAPELHYRLDGFVRLRQRQFLHADVTLDWRVPEMIGPTLWPVWNEAGEFSTHRLEQSRTIRPGRFEYFDSDWLGVLLRITPFEPQPVSEASTGSDAGNATTGSP